MKKLAFLAGAIALILSSCTQELPLADNNALQEVVFTSVSNDGGLKSDPFDCDNPDADYAKVFLSLDGNDLETIIVPVFYVNDVMYTQAIKLAPGDYTLEHFELWATDGTSPGVDLMVNAVPYLNSDYGELVTNALPAQVLVSAFTKNEIPISILCYEPNTHKDFGFTWFRVEENSVRSKYFFGDFCTKFFEDYDVEGSLYEGTGLALVDMPAIFQLDLYILENSNGPVWSSLINSFSNEDTFDDASPSPVVVAYPDLEADGDIFKLEVSIYVKTGNSFAYVNFGSWYWKDDSNTLYPSLDDLNNDTNGFTTGTGDDDDGVYDFILGNCNVDGADYIFAPYMNLPSSGTLEVHDDFAPSLNNAYFDIILTNIGTGYDVEGNIWIPTFCFDRTVTINRGVEYTVDIYSSLYPELMPSGMQAKEWDRLNWLANNLDQFPGYTWSDFQQAMWILEDPGWSGNAYAGVPAKTSITDDMVTAAILYGDAYVPMPGGWAAVSFANDGDPIQTVFIIVDP